MNEIPFYTATNLTALLSCGVPRRIRMLPRLSLAVTPSRLEGNTWVDGHHGGAIRQSTQQGR